MIRRLFVLMAILMGLQMPTVFIEIDPNEAVNMIESGTGILIFESEECPWCNAARPILMQAALEKNVKVYTANIQDIKDNPKENKPGTKEYSRILELLDEYLSEYLDENGESYGEKRVYIPDVYAIKDGVIMGHNLGTVESHKDKDKEMTSEQKAELKDIYINLINMVYEPEIDFI